jgi:hypothetical protein
MKFSIVMYFYPSELFSSKLRKNMEETLEGQDDVMYRYVSLSEAPGGRAS